jgi:hypothetical protein
MVLPRFPWRCSCQWWLLYCYQKGIRYWRNKNNRFLVSQFKLPRRKNREELASLILQNSSKQIAHTPKEKLLFESKIETHTFKSKTILLTSIQICKHSYFVNFKVSTSTITSSNMVSQADELVKCIAWFRKVIFYRSFRRDRNCNDL